MRKLSLALVLVLMTQVLTSCVAVPTPQGPDDSDLMSYISERTVQVKIYRRLYDGDKIFKETTPHGWGTGTVLWSKDLYSYVLTAQHVVATDGDFAIIYDEQTKDFKILRAEYFITLERRNLRNEVVDIAVHVEIVKTNSKLDLALLKVPYHFGIDNTNVALGVKLGEKIHCVGYPSQRYIKGAHISYAFGHIMSINLGQKSHPGVIRIGMGLYNGSSGGGIFNERGELVAVTQFMAGWPTDSGFLPLQNSFYGVGPQAIRHFLYTQK